MDYTHTHRHTHTHQHTPPEPVWHSHSLPSPQLRGRLSPTATAPTRTSQSSAGCGPGTRSCQSAGSTAGTSPWASASQHAAATAAANPGEFTLQGTGNKVWKGRRHVVGIDFHKKEKMWRRQEQRWTDHIIDGERERERLEVLQLKWTIRALLLEFNDLMSLVMPANWLTWADFVVAWWQQHCRITERSRQGQDFCHLADLHC